MNEDIRKLEPISLWNNFADLNAIPRPSKQEAKIIAFMKAFAANLNLPTVVDEVGNVIIKKTASPGLEKKQTVVLQCHLDMVHQKNADTNFDFATQGIDMFIDGDWVKARGTTLGADNGIGVAAIMSLLASTDIAHPALEALFTIDEETGMTGALSLKGGLLDASIMLNLDTEDDDELTIGCAGGIDVTATGSYAEVDSKPGKSFLIQIKGLTGGHSGVDIHLGRGNANKLLNRVLWETSNAMPISISRIDGGSLRNAIPREATAEIMIDSKHEKKLLDQIAALKKTLQTENKATDPNLLLEITESAAAKKVLDADFQKKILNSIYACPNGIYRMSAGIAGLVQTSNNLSRILIENGTYSIQCLTRSSDDTEKIDLAQAISATFQLSGATVEYSAGYPGWQPRPDSPIVQIMSSTYKKIFQEDAHVNAIHAGLECGILGTNYPEMQMISFGPNIYGAHSPDERVQISSVQKFWRYLLEVLKEIPDAT